LSYFSCFSLGKCEPSPSAPRASLCAFPNSEHLSITGSGYLTPSSIPLTFDDLPNLRSAVPRSVHRARVKPSCSSVCPLVGLSVRPLARRFEGEAPTYARAGFAGSKLSSVSSVYSLSRRFRSRGFHSAPRSPIHLLLSPTCEVQPESQAILLLRWTSAHLWLGLPQPFSPSGHAAREVSLPCGSDFSPRAFFTD